MKLWILNWGAAITAKHSAWLLIILSCSRYFKNIGLGFKTPQDAKDGTYIDKKCPWTGGISIRGKLLRGIVVSTKMKRYPLVDWAVITTVQNCSIFDTEREEAGYGAGKLLRGINFNPL